MKPFELQYFQKESATSSVLCLQRGSVRNSSRRSSHKSSVKYLLGPTSSADEFLKQTLVVLWLWSVTQTAEQLRHCTKRENLGCIPSSSQMSPQPADACATGAELVAPETWRNCHTHQGPVNFLCFKCNRQLFARFLIPIHLCTFVGKNIFKKIGHTKHPATLQG